MLALLLAAAPVLLLPSSDGVLDLPAILSAEQYRADAEPLPNPFRCHVHPPQPARELTVTVSGLVAAPGPSDNACILNAEEYHPGDRFAGLRIRSIGDEGVTLECPPHALLLPFQTAPFQLLLPR